MPTDLQSLGSFNPKVIHEICYQWCKYPKYLLCTKLKKKKKTCHGEAGPSQGLLSQDQYWFPDLEETVLA